jgi:hypothetical protein
MSFHPPNNCSLLAILIFLCVLNVSITTPIDQKKNLILRSRMDKNSSTRCFLWAVIDTFFSLSPQPYTHSHFPVLMCARIGERTKEKKKLISFISVGLFFLSSFVVLVPFCALNVHYFCCSTCL